MPENKPCIWNFDASYTTGCGWKPFSLDTPSATQGFKFCPFCGRPMKLLVVATETK